ncbi:sensor histidine kinase [Naumannella sp. ID2617S]|nr:sensor histidine kinase [Naumannella sp. ID2617S]
MPLMSRLIRQHTEIGPEDEEYLVRLVAEWHLLADLSFSDLVLWVPDVDPNIFWAVAQTRPSTGPTALEDDVAGDEVGYQPEHGVPEAYLTGEQVETSENKLQAGIPVDVHAVPIHRDGRVLAVIERHTNQMGVRAPGALEDNYLEMAEVLTSMVAHGEYPTGANTDPVLSPRVGDGVFRLDRNRNVRYATPNAITALRRLGLESYPEDEHLPSLLRDLAEAAGGTAPPDEAYRTSEVAEVEVSAGTVSIRLRLVPLRDGNGTDELIVLCRDITEINRRERQLVTKDATIREIHHRVKNNLQTVAALLRMQARRSPEARAALTEAMSRVAAIAVVHETLSQSFDETVAFDDVADRVLQMVGAVATSHDHPEGVIARREGSFGMVPAQVATSLSLVVTELCQNAIEHGLSGAGGGQVTVRPSAGDGALEVEVVDDGVGLPEDFLLASSKSLGLSIVSTLMADLGGTFELTNNPAGPGSLARICLPLARD